MSVHERDWPSFVMLGSDGGQHMDLAVEGVTCAACMVEIERSLAAVPGITNARLNLTSHRLAVDWQAGQDLAAEIVERLHRLGYTAHPFDPAAIRERGDREGKVLLRSMAVAGFAAMNIMLLSVSVWSGNATDITPETRDFFHWLSALIALPATAYAGRPFFRSAFAALHAGRLNMDVPIVIGVLLALALSLIQTVQHAEHAYYESSVMLLFFLLIGRFLDHNMRRKTRSFAENIAALKAETAARLAPDGTVREVPLSKVLPGERVLVRPGERVSLDGLVEEGTSEIDQSLVTGETALKAVGAGDQVYAGTLNASGNLTIRVTAASGATLLDDVNRLIETAAQAKSAYVRLADRAASLYAPVVHLAAGLTFLAWLIAGIGWQPALVIAISVLIITCPCALGLAIPAVQVVTSGLLFRSGVLLNAGDAIERLASVDTIVFDKTGTLTLALPELVNRDVVSQEVLALAGRLALSSHHPLAVALARASNADTPFADAAEQPGGGVHARDPEGRELRLGSPTFCGADPAIVEAVHARRLGASVIVFRIGEEPAHVLLMRQQLRPDARETIEMLVADGYAVEILSGDRRGPVAEVACELGIADWRAEASPKDKIARLEQLAAEGRRVLMVGDGLNDAPALAAAHVSLSPVTAVHLSQAAADAVFLGHKLTPVRSALAIARTARRAMVQNLWFSALYNVVAVPFAVAGFVTPLIAALAMSGSSIVVTANAIRLRLTSSPRGDRG
ncbi:cadmium-translocating P-type ATPase [Stappia sp. F7233]|uniref:Cadmium-translocating P-type ATPase n=1 Tax=Stappia albiluteola TaxID=2758565 RepID=A0A839AAD4_9HYPH|nr:heavy metal translocating P-type ATPase [Stappia albiluteola]MBA5776146.1 cadmium-translocating P-type ATPase [Stappia albiluteola]